VKPNPSRWFMNESPPRKRKAAFAPNPCLTPKDRARGKDAQRRGEYRTTGGAENTAPGGRRGPSQHELREILVPQDVGQTLADVAGGDGNGLGA
jgi:hypothetical protein